MEEFEEVPEWFKLSNYDECYRFSPEDWYIELYHRGGLLGPREGVDPETTKDLKKSYHAVINQIQSNGLITKEWIITQEKIYREEHPEEFDDDTVEQKEYDESMSLGSRSVHPLCVFMADQMGSFAAKCLSDDANKNSKEQTIIYSGQSPLDSRLIEENGSLHKAHICIDLSQPNHELEKAFHAFLPQYREFLSIQAVKKAPSYGILRKCLTYKILPYLDLYIWQQEQQLRLKRSTIKEILYPANEFSATTIKDTIHSYAMDVITEAFLERLKQKIELEKG